MFRHNIGPSSSSNQARRKHFSVSQTTSGESSLPGAPSLYLDLGDCDQACEYFHAEFWYAERRKGYSPNGRVKYSRCCRGGRVRLPFVRDPPKIIKELFKDRHFMESICAYNMMFAMTSFGANVGDSVNNGLGPYVFKVEGSARIIKIFKVSVLQLADFLIPCYVVSHSWLMILSHNTRLPGEQPFVSAEALYFLFCNSHRFPGEQPFVAATSPDFHDKKKFKTASRKKKAISF
ncbi:hypothetical protein Tco_0733786 [Tanacetum coccineum]